MRTFAIMFAFVTVAAAATPVLAGAKPKPTAKLKIDGKEMPVKTVFVFEDKHLRRIDVFDRAVSCAESGNVKTAMVEYRGEAGKPVDATRFSFQGSDGVTRHYSTAGDAKISGTIGEGKTVHIAFTGVQNEDGDTLSGESDAVFCKR